MREKTLKSTSFVYEQGKLIYSNLMWVIFYNKDSFQKKFLHDT